MPRARSVNLNTHMQQAAMSTAILLKVTRKDASVFGFTNHVAPIPFDAVTYEADSGFVIAEIETKDNLSTQNTKVTALLDTNLITEADVIAKKWLDARFQIMRINYRELADGVEIMSTGFFGEMTRLDTAVEIELRGLEQKLETNFIEVTTPLCRADLFGPRCNVNPLTFTATGTVATVVDARRRFTGTMGNLGGGAGAPPVFDFFTLGVVTWTTGNNAGLKMEVKAHITTHDFKLHLKMPLDIQVGDTFSVHRGCDHTKGVCIGIFNNATRARAEWHLPGIDKALQTAGTKDP